ncbi:MAG: ATP-dependent sacrificial sulfur transferase LarE [Photobacterium frigidiphilum]|uniref:ATP-dependent sacrificial sulfur transferase LarE n=1 Tax=Photobacterium frigidiphilum TaxID=264736 RepID=UPI00300287F9
MNSSENNFNKLSDYLQSLGKVTVAISGGVDSMTLAYVAHQVLGDNAKMVHSLSSAVPSQDTARIEKYAEQYEWDLELAKSGELEDSNYQKNPVNRCYYCKSCLYSKLASYQFGELVSGTNLDDLDDYRPGLIAAKEHGVKHPYVEVGIDKQAIRLLSAYLNLPELAALPASPCLSSRIETGIQINASNLGVVEKVERYLRQHLPNKTLRCRIQHNQVGVEIQSEVLAKLSVNELATLKSEVMSLTHDSLSELPIQFMPYKMGSAFIGVK